MIDFDGLMLAPIYDAFGVDAVIKTADGATITLTVKDDTAGVMLESQNGGFQTATSKPAACVRQSVLTENGLTRKSLSGATITFNGNDWKIVSTQPKPVPSGPGELYLILQSI